MGKWTCITLGIACFVFGADNSAEEQDSAGNPWPPTVLLLYPSQEDPSGGPPKPNALVLSVSVDGQWSTHGLNDLLQTDFNGNPVELGPENKARIERLLNETFYDAADFNRVFQPTATNPFWVISSRHLGLTGDIQDFGEIDPADSNVIAVNRRGPLGELGYEAIGEPSNLAPFIQTRLIGAASQIKPKPRNDESQEILRVDPKQYQEVEIREVFRFRIDEDREALWVVAFREYPRNLAPETRVPDYAMWSMEYRALLEEQEGGAYEVLWEAIEALDDPWSTTRQDLIGVCDGDGDGVSEVVMYEHAHEYKAIFLFTHSDGRYGDACRRSGAV